MKWHRSYDSPKFYTKYYSNKKGDKCKLMIEIGHNLQHAIEFGMLLSAMVAAVHIVMKFVTEMRSHYKWFM